MSATHRRIATAVALLLVAPTAAPYGAAGHRIAHLAAEPLLCARTAEQVAALSGGERFAELGSWADRIRGQDRWMHTGPWHYLNLADDADLNDFEHPPEGDVLAAIATQAAAVGDEGLSAGARREALKFLVHFIVDVHQPLHVGRAEDRGGNATAIRYRDENLDLHGFWDTDAILLAGLSAEAYAASLGPAVARFAALDAGSEPVDWAAESLALRRGVYAYADGVADAAYLERAVATTRQRLTFAAARLANTLNEIFCR